MVVCRGTETAVGTCATLVGVIDEMVIKPSELPFDFAPTVAVGYVLGKGAFGKRLGIQAYRLVDKGEPEPIEGFQAAGMVLPSGRVGPGVCSLELPMKIQTGGVLGISLFDLEGAFGKPAEQIATYVFGVRIDSSLAFEDN